MTWIQYIYIYDIINDYDHLLTYVHEDIDAIR